MQDSWLIKKANEIQSFADRQDPTFFAALKSFYGTQASGTAPVMSADGSTLITDKAKILERWAEHVSPVLNRPFSINDEAIDRLSQIEINSTMDRLPEEEEVEKAINVNHVLWKSPWI